MLARAAARRSPTALQAVSALAPGSSLQARGLVGSTSVAAVEKGPHQTGTAEDAQQPFVEEQGLASKREIRESYQGVLADASSTAEDVSVKDQAQSSLGSMMRDPRDVEGEYAQAARDTVAPHGGRERETEDDQVADAVFDQTRSDKGYDENTKAGQPWDGSYARKPQ